MSAYILSVVLPTYNTEAYLNRCIDSLLDKRINGKVEIIVVNDGSKDNSLAIARSYETQYPFVVVVDKENGGHGSTINEGAKIARGKYFRVLDSDDWFDTEVFVAYVDKLTTADTDAVVTWLYLDYTYENRKVPQALFGVEKSIEYGRTYTFDTLDFKKAYIQMAELTYKTEIVRKAKSLMHNTFYVDNEFLIYPMLYVHTFVFWDMYIYHYFIGRPEQSMSLPVMERNIDHIRRVALQIAAFIENSGIEGNKHTYLCNIVTNICRSYYTRLLAYFHRRRIWAYRLLKTYDVELKEANPSFYHIIAQDKFIRAFHTAPWLTTMVAPYIYSMLGWFKKK